MYVCVYRVIFCSFPLIEGKEKAEIMSLLDTVVTIKAKIVCIGSLNESTPPPSKYIGHVEHL